MDPSLAKWLSGQEMDDEPAFIHQSQMGSLYDTTDTFDFKDFCSESYSTNPSFTLESTQFGYDEKPAKKLLINHSNTSTTEKTIKASNSSSSSTIISFGNSILQSDNNSNPYGELGYAEGTQKVFVTPRGRWPAQDHVLAERKRRERVNQRLVALSALIPGLKKLDKASVLGDAIKHIKQLQERVKTLEEEVKERNVEATVVSSSDENWDNTLTIPKQFFPQIDVRVSDRNVLLRIHTKKHSGYIVKIFSEIEKLHLTIVSSNVMPFANTSLLITIIAQMELEFCMTANDLVKKLRLAIMKFV